MGGGVQPSLPPQPIESRPDDQELKALQFLYEKAKLVRNDVALKFYRHELRQVLRERHEGVQPSSVLLRKRAKEQLEGKPSAK